MKKYRDAHGIPIFIYDMFCTGRLRTAGPHPTEATTCRLLKEVVLKEVVLKDLSVPHTLLPKHCSRSLPAALQPVLSSMPLCPNTNGRYTHGC